MDLGVSVLCMVWLRAGEIDRGNVAGWGGGGGWVGGMGWDGMGWGGRWRGVRGWIADIGVL